MNNLAIIPARSGSKGVKDKNIKLLGGKPLMAYTIEAALKSRVFNEVMVSTDSSIYASIAKNYGAEVPFLRSRYNSQDSSESWDTVREVLDMYKQQGKNFDTICLLQPTSPLRIYRDIQNAYQKFSSKSAKAVVSICEADHPLSWYNRLPEDECLENFIRQTEDMQRQKEEKYYRINGAIYIVSSEIIKNNLNIYQKGSFAYVMERENSIDIDTELDFLYAETILGKG